MLALCKNHHLANFSHALTNTKKQTDNFGFQAKAILEKYSENNC